MNKSLSTLALLAAWSVLAPVRLFAQLTPEDDAFARAELAAIAPDADEARRSAWANAIVEKLLPGASAERIEDRATPQTRLDRLAALASAPGNGPIRAALCAALAARTTSATPQPGRLWILRMLERYGGRECAAALGELLRDEDERISDAARRALQSNGSSEASEVLRSAVKSMADGAARAALLDSLAARSDEKLCEIATPLAASPDDAVARAAISAIGASCGVGAIEPLLILLHGEDALRQSAAADALLRIGQRSAGQGQRDPARAAFMHLVTTSRTPLLQSAGLRGLALVDPDEALSRLTPIVVGGESPELWPAALTILREISGDAAGAMIADAVGGAPADRAPFLIDVLADRGDRGAMPALLMALESSHAPVRAAALRALQTLGGEPAITPITQRAASADANERKLIVETLARIPGIDDAILARLGPSEPPASRAVLIAASSRRSADGEDAFFDALLDPHADVQQAGWEALAEHTTLDHLVELVALLNESRGPTREIAETAMVAIARRADRGDERIASSLAENASGTPSLRASLIRILGRLGTPRAMHELRGAIADPSDDVVDAAVRQLAEWPSSDALDVLVEVASRPRQPVHAILATRGFARLVRKSPGGLSPDEVLARIERVLALPLRVEERRLVVSAAGECGSARAMSVIRPLLKDAELRPAAAASLAAAAARALADDPDGADAALEELSAGEFGPQIAKSVADARQLQQKFAGFLGKWDVAGPFHTDGKKAAEIFDVAYPPESGEPADWRPLTARSKDSPWVFDLTRIDGGANRCIYARTIVHSEEAQPARLEIASDDGVKVWVNGKLVHGVSRTRGLTLGEDKVAVELRPGDNEILLKVMQEAGGWGFAAALRSPDGGELGGVRKRE